MLVLDGHPSTVYAVAFSPDGRLLATGTRDGTVWLWDDGYEKHEFLAEPPPGSAAGAPADPINGIDFHPAGHTVVVAGGMGWLGRQTLPDGFRVFGPPRRGGATAVRYLSAKLLAVGYGHRAKTEPGGFELWDADGRRRMEPHFPAARGVRAVAVLPAKRLAAWADGDRAAFVWETTKPTPWKVGLPQPATSLALHPDGTQLAAAVDRKVVRADFARRQVRDPVAGHVGVVTAVAYSPDGRTLASASWDGTVRLWDAATGAEVRRYEWGVGKLFSLAYSPDGLRMAAGGDQGAAVVWDVE